MSTNPNQPSQHKTLPMELEDDDFEVITSEEVDSVLDALEQLIAAAQSENIRACLEEAADNIYALVYSDDNLLDQPDGEQDEAA